ncbi:MAG TPA: sialidase family protein [Pyrinomonadaceae bacterium]|jgi:hypothetical protein
MKRILSESFGGYAARVARVAAVLALAASAGCVSEAGRSPNADSAAPAAVSSNAADGVRRLQVSADGAEPGVAAAPDGSVYVAWVAHRPGKRADVWLSRFDGEGRQAGAPARVNPTEGEATAWRGDPPDVAVAPDGAVYVAWTARASEGAHATTLYLSASRDGGRSFDAPARVNDDAGVGEHGMHSLAAARDGRVYLAWLDERNAAPPAESQPGGQSSAPKGSGGMHGERNREVFFAASADGGRTFSGNRSVAKEACPCCKTALAVGADGRVYVGWRQVLPGDFRHIAVAASADGGESFNAPVVVSDDRWELSGCPVSGPALAAGEGGSLRVVWYTAGEAGRPGLYGSDSADGGRTFAPRRAVREGDLRGTPALLADGRGRLVTVFQGADASGANGLWLAGATADGPPATLLASGETAAAASQNGRLYVAYVSQGGVWLALPPATPAA